MRLFLILALVQLTAGSVWASGERKATIAWKEVEGVKEFEFQLSTNAKMDPVKVQKKISGVKVEVNLEPGTYYFRVRGIDAEGSAGPWAEVQGFVVTPKAPALTSPDDGKTYGTVPHDGIPLAWDGVGGKDGFLLEVADANGIVLKRTVQQNKFAWTPTVSGKYKWRVGAESAMRTDWTPYRSFEATVKAVSAPTMFVAEVEENKDAGAPSSTSVIFRWAQSVLAYSARDQDKGIAATGSAVVALLSAELRWRAKRSGNSPWVLSGSLNFEMIRQTVFMQTFSMPRGYLRAFFTKGKEQWRAGPFIHLGMGQGGIFIAQGATTGVSTKVMRTGMGLGGVAVYQIAPTAYLSMLGLLRLDSGGTSPQIPTKVGSVLGYEVGFGVVLSLSESMLLEGRIRGQKEGYVWAPANGSSINSFQNNTFLIVDLGIGFKF